MRVVKLGGSLLNWPELPSRLRGFIDQLTPNEPTLIVVGGGDLVEAVRSLHKAHCLEGELCHWLCVELMDVTAWLAHSLFPEWQCIYQSDELKNWVAQNGVDSSVTAAAEQRAGRPTETCVAIVLPTTFYSRQCNADALPKSWDTTSDSISALLARVVGAQELIVLKSTDAFAVGQRHSQLPDAAERGIVDAYFASSVPEGVSVHLVNLRTFGDWSHGTDSNPQHGD
ncbi:MAG: hypothetical protein KF752_12310 [Pirellulaceae bacterium]|nr:hypothetical protein [Pirellulaceae bacterium]